MIVRIRRGLVPAWALRRWLRLAAHRQIPHAGAMYEVLLAAGWNEAWPLVLLRRPDGVTKLLDGRRRLRAAPDDLPVPVLWLVDGSGVT